jgi:uncharacterized RDD family membrane protein YckC
MEDTNNIQYSKWYTRTAAYFIDSIILVLAISLLQLPITISLGLAEVPEYVDGIITYINSLILTTIYYYYFLTKDGTTPGLQYLGLKIVKEDGSLLSTGDTVVRTLIFNILLLISIITIPFNSKKQGIHDLVVKSICINNQQKEARGKWITGLCCSCSCFAVIIFILLIIMGLAGSSIQ